MENIRQEQGLEIRRVKSYNKSQFSLLTKAFAVAGLAFLLICGIGFGFGQLINSQRDWIAANNVTDALWATSFILLMISSVLTIVWCFKLGNASKAFVFMTYAVYIIGWGCSFGIIFALLRVWELASIFGIVGGIMLLMSIIGLCLKDKQAFSLMKAMMIVIFASFMFMMVGSIFMFISLFLAPAWLWDWYYFLSWIITAIISCMVIIFTVYQLNNMNEFYNLTDNNQLKFNLVMFFGFRILSSLVQIFYLVAMMFIRFRR